MNIMNPMTSIPPIVGCAVQHPLSNEVGFVVENHDTDACAKVRWLSSGRVDSLSWSVLQTALTTTNVVQEHPLSRTRQSRGLGRVQAIRTLAGRDQVLVEFFDSHTCAWVPHQSLIRVPSPDECFFLPGPSTDEAERFRLKTLAHAFEHWNENTGALSRLDVDPLPHQIHLVHHLLADGNLNWMIADDVGLGKTIEVGMLLAALRQRPDFQRILIVTPAGLVRQWQDELREKFHMDDFRVYGDDFKVPDVAQWPLYPRVIASIDRLKSAKHLSSVLNAPPWSMVVFDEAHKLTRQQYGLKYQRSDRFELAAALRNTTDNFLFLTATPHQGRDDQFKALLELLRPELKPSLDTQADIDPNWLNDCVFRNRKADVTDADGEFIFHGQTSTAIAIPIGEPERVFDKALRRYIRAGYRAAEKANKTFGFAIGFVMTTFRKLAASSPSAIVRSLERRLAKVDTSLGRIDPTGLDDERFLGEWEEDAAAAVGGTFFEEERGLLTDLLELGRALVLNDVKLEAFLDHVIAPILAINPSEKVVIFSEYRATQTLVQQALAKRFGAEAVTLINGSMNHNEKRESVRRFNDNVQFMVSTEAGGFGINLHFNCNHMVNYDLPWNPMRLVQRVGRIYRYGQTKRVLAFNLHAPDTMDGKIVDVMYDRINQVVRDLSGLGDEFNENLHEEIFGQIASALDVQDILRDATLTGETRTQARIEEAIERAKNTRDLHETLFSHVHQFDPNALRGELQVGREHLCSFVPAILEALGCQVTVKRDGLWDVHLTDDLRDAAGYSRSRVRLTVDRGLARRASDTEILDFGNPLFRVLVDRAKSFEFGGQAAALRDLPETQSLFAVLLSWQNDQGQRMREELTLIEVQAAGSRSNSAQSSYWLHAVAKDGDAVGTREARRDALHQMKAATERRLGEVSNRHLHPAGARVLACGWFDET